MQQKLKFELESAGTFVIAASPKKLQVMRHQASQLGSIKNLDLDEIEYMRSENEIRLKELEEMYMRKRETGQVGKIIRDKMGYSAHDRKSPRDLPSAREGADFDRDEDFDQEAE